MSLQYPYNIVRQLKIELLTNDVKDIEKALEYAMDTELTTYEKELFLLKYKEYYTFKQLSEKFGYSVNQMSNTIYRCLNRMGTPKYISYICYGYSC